MAAAVGNPTLQQPGKDVSKIDEALTKLPK
jgi:hypothetical protein